MAVEERNEHTYPGTSHPGIGSSTLSMREKSQIKRRVNKEHNSNFRAGYIEINEEYLHKTGIRGRKRYLLYTFVGVLVVLALLNALVTAWLVYKFRIFHIGMVPMEFVKGDATLRFMEDAEIRVVKVSSSMLGGRYGKNFSITGSDAPMILGTQKIDGSSLKLDGGKVTVASDNFLVKNRSTGETVFKTGEEKIVISLTHAKNLHALSVQVEKLMSRRGYRDIVIESHKQIKILGAEGVMLKSEKNVAMDPSGSVILNATGGHILLQVQNGNIYLNRSLPQPPADAQVNPDTVAYKLCVCADSGRLFGVPEKGPGSGCAALNEQQNPCDLS